MRSRTPSRDRPRFGSTSYFATLKERQHIHEANAKLVSVVAKKVRTTEWDVLRAIWREARIVGTAAGTMTLIVWAVRMVNQLFDARLMNEGVLLGQHNQFVADVENRIDYADRGGKFNG